MASPLNHPGTSNGHVRTISGTVSIQGITITALIMSAFLEHFLTLEPVSVISSGGDSEEVSSPVSSRMKEKFRKTHKRNESKVSRVSRLSVRSLRGNTLDDVDETDEGEHGQGSGKRPIYFLDR